MVSAALFSSASDLWETPAEVFDPLHAEFGFALDAAATRDSARVAEYLGPDHVDVARRNALVFDWPGWGPVWLNPPYSRGQQVLFIAKAAEQAMLGRVVVALLPVRTDTRAFHASIWDARLHRPRPWVREIRFLRGRVRFRGAESGAPFPSMVVVFSE